MGDDQRRRNRGIRSDDGSRVRSGNDYRDVVVRCVWKTNCGDGSSGFGDRWRWKWKGWDRWQFLLSMYITNNGGRRRGLRSAARLNKEWLKLSNDVGCNKLVEYVIAAGLQIRDSFFEGEDGGAGSEVVMEAGDGGVISSKKVFNV